MTIINNERNYLELNQSIKMMRVKKVILKKLILLKNVKI